MISAFRSSLFLARFPRWSFVVRHFWFGVSVAEEQTPVKGCYFTGVVCCWISPMISCEGFFRTVWLKLMAIEFLICSVLSCMNRKMTITHKYLSSRTFIAVSVRISHSAEWCERKAPHEPTTCKFKPLVCGAG